MMWGEINYRAVAFWRDIGVLLVCMVSMGYTWWRNRETVNSKRFLMLETKVEDRVTRSTLELFEKERESRCERHRERTGSIEAELTRLHTEVNNLPDQADISRVHARIDEVLGQGKELVGEMRASRRQLDLMMEELMKRD